MDEQIEEMRRQVRAHDNAKERERGLSSVMMAALGSLPIRCPGGVLPTFAPAGGTLQALERRELAMRVEIAGEPRWMRTALGEAVWENR